MQQKKICINQLEIRTNFQFWNHFFFTLPLYNIVYLHNTTYTILFIYLCRDIINTTSSVNSITIFWMMHINRRKNGQSKIILNQRLSRACIVHLVIKKINWSYVKTMSCSGSHLGITINIKNTKFVKDLPMIDA